VGRRRSSLLGVWGSQLPSSNLKSVMFMGNHRFLSQAALEGCGI
jgi:hypothetical protein